MRAAGSVHAVDAETALQNAWAVYGRRPTAVALWVVPRHLVVTKSRQELEGLSASATDSPAATSAREQKYCVFFQSGARITYDEATPVEAASAEQALLRAAGQRQRSRPARP
jgi:ring-1,2-phenylacetyl-CoA epoxidase subunit PaaB